MTRGLRGPRVTVHHVDKASGILAYHRWQDGGPRDDVLVVVNLSAEVRSGVPREGHWRVRFNSAWKGYDPEFASIPSLDADAMAEPLDRMPSSIGVAVGPYASVILSHDE